jgi:hypothetical protein
VSSVLTAFFLADDGALEAIRASAVISPRTNGFPYVEFRGLSPVALVTLDAAVTGDDATAITDDVLSEPLAILDDGEQLLLATRPVLLTALRDLTDIETAASAWAATEEMRLDGFSDDNCAAMLRELSALAREAHDEEHLFVWLCV